MSDKKNAGDENSSRKLTVIADRLSQRQFSPPTMWTKYQTDGQLDIRSADIAVIKLPADHFKNSIFGEQI